MLRANLDAGFWSDYFFAAILKVCVYRNISHMVRGRITTSVASIFEETVAIISENFILCQKLLLVQRDYALNNAHESNGKHAPSVSSQRH
jgi:hypothetical protein